ncbi:Para-aminobenzoate synthase, aminase component / Aminodeoxychorismate lyase [hydrothermal vent metagenome]|uniref:Para-aminobenzoate synthase, aminase component / Aminodeoxychorismate lyase n=1 Tax=hydrothermal vent metagenome TaxID=652676 RepID=A0A3B0S2V9_9ZZZZ
MAQKSGGNFSVFLDNNCSAQRGAPSYLFQNPAHMVVARKSGEIAAAFDQVRDYLAAGYYVAGWISYETGLFMEGRLAMLGQETNQVPFLSFGIYDKRQKMTSEESEDHWAEKSAAGYAIENMRLNITRADYAAAFDKIQDYLTAGDVYQVNFTLKALFDFSGNAEACFAALRKAQRVEYGAVIQSDDLSVLSLSPELFFRKDGQNIITRPMKGTCGRGRTLAEDGGKADFMQQDDKSRAENLMIVDLLRNDLAKISEPASVKLKSLYDVEKYSTLFQMTSTIEAKVPGGADMVDLIKALFPCGSVTGAPKIRAMEIISELEQSPRGIYTGAIGYMGPDGECCFSVPIRTLTLDKDGRGEMGIGSAIVADSDVQSEYDECLLKADFAVRPFRDFHLIESLRWDKEGFHLLDRHMERLLSSAEYFDFAYDQEAILNDLSDHAQYLDPRKIWKVRLLLSLSGQISITSAPVEESGAGKVITLSRKVMDSRNVMLFHKTTDRTLYDQELKHHRHEYDSYDVIFINEKDEVTEGAFNNIFVKQGDSLYTPPVECGLLGGILRQSLMADGVKLQEKILTVPDLQQADHIYMGNSVRGLVEVIFLAHNIPDPPG